MYYMLITVSPTGTMTCQLTTNYMQAEQEDLPPGYFAFVVKAESFQVRHNHQMTVTYDRGTSAL
jgi:hypothetical protein